jgi:hypothetical protein
MKFKQLSINPNHSKECFEVSITNVDGERENRHEPIYSFNTITYSNDFMSDEKAFNDLKLNLIGKHNELIDNYTKSLEKLLKISFNNDVVNQ